MALLAYNQGRNDWLLVLLIVHLDAYSCVTRHMVNGEKSYTNKNTKKLN